MAQKRPKERGSAEGTRLGGKCWATKGLLEERGKISL